MHSIYAYVTALHLVAMAACLVAFVVQSAWPTAERRWVVWLAVFGLVCFGATVLETAWNSELAFDFDAFRAAGRDMLEGRDPVDGLANSNLPAPHPPSAYPLFAILALAPRSLSFAIWAGVSAALGLGLVRLTRAALPGERTGFTQLRPPLLLVLTALFVMSNAFRACLTSGQLAALETFMIVTALWLRKHGRPVLSGVALAVATIKIGTMVPFLLLFHERRDRITWLVMFVTTAALCLSTGYIVETPQRVQKWLATISRLSETGAVNDFTYAVPDHGMIALDHAFYRAGFKSRSAAKLAQAVALVVLGAWVGFEVLARSRFSHGGKTALVAFYSLLFLYHRLHDALILVIPLVYATIRAQETSGRPRTLYLATAFCTLPVLLMLRRVVDALRDLSRCPGLAGHLVEAVLSPYACWLILTAMGLLAWVEYRESSGIRRESA